MATAAFLTYNSVGEPGSYPSGPLERNGHTAIIVQHPRGQRWGAEVDGQVPLGPRQSLEEAESESERQQMISACEARRQLVAELYAGFADLAKIAELDYLVVYVGAEGSQGALLLASQAPQGKVRIVTCDCSLLQKLEDMSQLGITAPYLVCECGGQTTMENLVEEFLRSGLVGPKTT